MLKILESYAGKSGGCYPSQKTLAREVKRTARTVRRALIALESKRGISWARGATANNVYKLNAKMSAAADTRKEVTAMQTIKLRFEMSAPKPKVSSGMSAQMSASSLISEATLNPQPKSIEESEARKENTPMSEHWNPQKSPEERKLLRLARRWCDRNAPEALWPLDGLVIAQQLYDAGALSLSEDAAWSEWPKIEGLKPKASQPAKGETFEASERLRATLPLRNTLADPERKPVGMAEAIRAARKLVGE